MFNFGRKKKGGKTAIETTGYEVRLEAGAAANEPLLARAQGRIDRLQAKKKRWTARGLDTAGIDAALARWRRQRDWSYGELHGHGKG